MPPRKQKIVLTPEEKKARRIARRAEKKRQAAIRARQIKLNHLERELKYGNLTVKRHEKSWKKLLTIITIPRMRNDLKYAWHNFERIIDAKDFTISLLMDELNDSEEQYMMNLRNHAENIDKLINMFHNRLKELKSHNESEFNELRAEGRREAEMNRLTGQDGEEYLKTMLYGLEVRRKAQEKRVRAVYLSKIDEESTKYADIIHTLKNALEEKLANVWNNTNKFLSDYNHRTAKRKKDYDELKEQDDHINALIQEQRIKIKTHMDTIRKLKQRFNNVKQQQNTIILDLIYEKNVFTRIFYILKDRLEKDNDAGMKNLVVLTTKSKEAIAALNNVKRKGTWILKLAGICSKLETVYEKILPFPIITIVNPLAKQDSQSMLFENDELYLFWQKVASADTLRYSINEEAEYLKKENRLLKIQIHRFCECLDCPSLPPVPSRRKPREVNVTDINQVVGNYKKFNG